MMDSVEEDNHWMARALALAARAEGEGEVPVGALVVKEGAVLGQGYNRPIGACDPTAHAEVNALRDAAARAGNYRLPGSTLYVTIEPCTLCVGAILHARVARLVFGAREPRAGAVASHLQLLDRGQYNHRVAWEEGVMAGDCSALIRAFFQSRR